MTESKSVSGVKYTAAAAGYFEKRTLRRTAGVVGLWGLGIAAVISGAFSGWNPGLGQAGWGGLLIATLIVVVMYFCMLFSIGEMSAAMPLSISAGKGKTLDDWLAESETDGTDVDGNEGENDESEEEVTDSDEDEEEESSESEGEKGRLVA